MPQEKGLEIEPSVSHNTQRWGGERVRAEAGPRGKSKSVPPITSAVHQWVKSMDSPIHARIENNGTPDPDPRIGRSTSEYGSTDPRAFHRNNDKSTEDPQIHGPNEEHTHIWYQVEDITVRITDR